MTNCFLDSAISKSYMQETGSAWITALVAPAAGHVIVVSQPAIVEVSSALARKQRLAQISAADAAQNRADFLLEATVTLGEPFTFVCADTNLLNAAAVEGFATDKPYLHPGLSEAESD
ncbi:MAG: type II toxin-antitoxin system VapC family toxin [Aggregatilineales bacterium]